MSCQTVPVLTLTTTPPAFLTILCFTLSCLVSWFFFWCLQRFKSLYPLNRIVFCHIFGLFHHFTQPITGVSHSQTGRLPSTIHLPLFCFIFLPIINHYLALSYQFVLLVIVCFSYQDIRAGDFLFCSLWYPNNEIVPGVQQAPVSDRFATDIQRYSFPQPLSFEDHEMEAPRMSAPNNAILSCIIVYHTQSIIMYLWHGMRKLDKDQLGSYQSPKLQIHTTAQNIIHTAQNDIQGSTI